MSVAVRAVGFPGLRLMASSILEVHFFCYAFLTPNFIHSIENF